MTHDEIKAIIEEKEALVKGQLKDFQLATVERVTEQFRKGQNRILISDEVGLGKTMVAKGVIVEMARIRMLEEGDDNFKVIYVCSNQNIAHQNIDTLDIFRCGSSDIGSRLSEVHLGLARRRAHQSEGNFIEMIPLTPSTSFKISAGQGTICERALIYVILRRIQEIEKDKELLFQFLRKDVNENNWNYWIGYFENEIATLESIEWLNYPNSIISIIKESHWDKIERLLDFLHGENTVDWPSKVIGLLRTMFAEISVSELNPDLVIMDEFQRFKFLIDTNDSEATVISRKFLTNEYDDNVDQRRRILLLSATPYKLYSTFEEREASPCQLDEHYTEFLNVIHFLEEGNLKKRTFDKIWSDYSHQLHLLHKGDISLPEIKQVKLLAEDMLYQFMCRTERLSVMKSEDYIDDSSRNKHVELSEYDIKEYVDIMQLLKELNINKRVPVDYVKSCPYLLSFMHDYEVKRVLNNYFKKHKEQIDIVGKKANLWINKSAVNSYKLLPESNSRLKVLFNHCFKGNSALFLWIPPTFPYYKLEGIYAGAEELNYSKVLLFSAWEMVPRMIACLTSYEAERRTVAELCRKKEKPLRYDLDRKKRYPAQRFTIRMRKDDRGAEQPATMALFSLLYPCKVLASLFNPSDILNKGIKSLSDIESEIRSALSKRLEPFVIKYGNQTGAGDSWYYLAPFLLDLSEDESYVNTWLAGEEEKTQESNSAYSKHIAELKDKLHDLDALSLGKIPGDLVDVLVDMTLGGFATCIYRRLSSVGGSSFQSTLLAKSFIDRFNTTETVAIVELSSGKNRSENSHWEDMLRYAKNGCFQSMFDEYFNLIHCSKEGDVQKAVLQIIDDINIGTVSNKVEGARDYKRYITKSVDDDSDKTSMRCHFAMGFSAGNSVDEKSVRTKDNIRHAFNSPLRPFVLASTSIGQEGLDFHLYCRKIMHWNLPSNPIDLEQREGRINRFKCLAIRQNIARDYSSTVSFGNDIWNSLFEAAEQDKKKGESDLVPFWCYNKPDGIKIERILPLYPLSCDISKYERMIEILSSYRLTLGQARQEELLEYVFKNVSDISELEGLFFDLSPFSKIDNS